MNLGFTQFFLWIAIILVAMALPPAVKRGSFRRFFSALLLSFFGIGLPLFVFTLSAALVPDWKGGCLFNWGDAFHEGKLALYPLVLWACSALYAVEIWQVQDRSRAWIRLGFLQGAVVASISTLYGIAMWLGSHIKNGIDWHKWLASGAGLNDNTEAFLLVPLYVAIWFSLRTVQLLKLKRPGTKFSLSAFGFAAPFWIASLVYSRKIYEALPDTPPDCFVVTAASRGHRCWVGTPVPVWHRGTLRQATPQLATLWRFEELWQLRAPTSHRVFRTLYNRAGPLLAAQITSPWAADAAFVLLKPIELLATAVLSAAQGAHPSQNVPPLQSTLHRHR